MITISRIVFFVARLVLDVFFGLILLSEGFLASLFLTLLSHFALTTLDSLSCPQVVSVCSWLFPSHFRLFCFCTFCASDYLVAFAELPSTDLTLQGNLTTARFLRH